MRKILVLALAGIVVLGACGGHDNDKTSSQNKSHKKEEKSDKKESNNQDTNNNQYKNSANDQGATNEKITPEKAEQIAYDKYKSVYPREYFKYDSERSNSQQYKVSFPWKDATGYPIQSLAVIDSSSGEIITVKNDNSEDEERKRAENHLRTSLVVNKLDDDIIKKYKPNEYNKIKKYANQHPNAFSEEGGIDNQQKVDEILGYNDTSNSKNDEDENNSTNSNENKDKANPSNQEEPNKAQNNLEDPNEKQTNNDQTTEEDHDKENKNEQPNSNKDDQEDSQQEHTDQNNPDQNDSTQDANSNEDEDN